MKLFLKVLCPIILKKLSLSQLGLWPEIPDACFEAVKEKPPLSVTACEPTVNRTVIQQMRSTILKDYFIVDNETRLGDDNYSQYQSSREDFGIHSLCPPADSA